MPLSKMEFLFFLRKGYALFDRKSKTACMMELREEPYHYEKSKVYYTNGLYHYEDKEHHCFDSDTPDLDIAGFWATNRNGDKEFFAVGDSVMNANDKPYTVDKIGIQYPNNPFLLCNYDGMAVYFAPSDVVVMSHNRDVCHADLLFRWFGNWTER